LSDQLLSIGLTIAHWLGLVVAAFAILGALYTATAAATALQAFRRPRRRLAEAPAVTIIKPLKGFQPGLAGALERFCQQDYAGPIQIIFGVHDDADPAIEVVRALQRSHPDLDIELTIDPRIYGANLKVSNLINILAVAKHEVLIMSDADVLVAPDYASNIAAALSEPGVGLVSTFYVGEALGGVWARLSAMAINYQFMPGAVLGKMLGLEEPCFGPTIALTRDILERIGGLAAFTDILAEDYEIGRAVRALGLKIAMPPMTVGHICDESGAQPMIDRELRWGRTVLQINPAGYAGSLITYPLPLALIAAALLGFAPFSLALIVIVLALRLGFRTAFDLATGASAGRWWWLPVSDILAFGLFVASFGVNRVGWQGTRFRVSREGVLLQS
jgi:ceramide glucosyltransferase